MRYRVDSLPEESSLSVLSRLAEHAGNAQSGIEQLTKKLIPYFSIIVVAISSGSFFAHYFLLHAGFEKAIVSAIAVLIVSCPCALALSVPTAAGAAMYNGLKNGILIRDGAVLEILSRVKEFFFDKTGTLTAGRPSVIDSILLKGNALSIVETMEEGSTHPVGRSLLDFVRKSREDESVVWIGDDEIVLSKKADQIEEIPGRGMIMQSGDESYRLGNPTFHEIAIPESINDFIAKYNHATVVVLSSKTEVLAAFALADVLEDHTAASIEKLKEKYKINILTGDAGGPARGIAEQLHLDIKNVHYNLLPQDKERIIQEASDKEVCCMVGDGFNDAIALSRASVSVGLSRGAPLSLEHAGVILLQNDLRGVLHALRIAASASKNMKLNLGFSFLYNSVMIPLAAAGLMLPVWCALLMAASSLTVVATSTFFRIRGS